MPTFSVVATPIGNLEDITLRALKVLSLADLVLCEDTRMTKRLLDHHNIKVETRSYHAHSEMSRTAEIIQLLKENKSIALVSDAGTPAISDPGSELVRIIRTELAEEIRNGSVKIETIPGASALTAALSIAGVKCADFTFLGFLPHKKGRDTLFNEIIQSDRTMVFYESPHRIMKTLETLFEKAANHNNPPGEDTSDLSLADLSAKASAEVGSAQIRGIFSWRVTVCRELTKIFEEAVGGTPLEVKDYFESHPDKIRGEFVVIVSREK